MMEEGDKIMVIEDGRPVFLTVESTDEMPRQGKIVRTKERTGYYLWNDCYTREQINSMFEDADDESEGMDRVA